MRFSAATEAADHPLTAEQDLWVAVVAQAVRDLAWWNHGESEERVHPDWRDVANAIWDLEVTKS